MIRIPDSMSDNPIYSSTNATSEASNFEFFSLVDFDKLRGELFFDSTVSPEDEAKYLGLLTESTTSSIVSANQSIRSNISISNSPELSPSQLTTTINYKRQTREQNEAIEKTIENEISILDKILKTYSDDERVERLDEELFSFSRLDYAHLMFGNVIQQLGKRLMDYPDRLADLCMSLSRYDYSDKLINAWGYYFLASIVNFKNQDEQLLESAVCLIDNWKNKELIDLLKHLQVGSEWLRLYIEDVIGE